MGTITYTTLDNPAEFDFAGKANITFTGRGADGSFVDPDNGGSAATFAGAIDLSVQADNGNDHVTIFIPYAGQEQSLSITGGDGGSGALQVFGGLNGNDGGSAGYTATDDYSWITSGTSGTDSSITDGGADGSLTFNWTDAPTGSPAAYFTTLQGGT